MIRTDMIIMILMKVTSDFCRIKFIEKKLKRKKKFLSDKSRLHPNNMIVGACIVWHVTVCQQKTVIPFIKYYH